MTSQDQTSRPLDPVDILLVDDHRENLIALSAILDQPDYRLVSVTSGHEALKRLLKQSFALVLLDVRMPEMDGYEVAAFVKKRESSHSTPIIFLTAEATDVQNIFKGYQVGAVDYLSKPLAPEVVRAKVAVFVELYRNAKEIERQAEILAEKERKENEYELELLKRSEEQRFRDLTNSIPQIIWTAGSDGVLLYCNEKWIEYTGLTLEQSRNRGWKSVVHPEDLERSLLAWEESLKNSSILDLELRLQQAGTQNYRWHLARAIPRKDPQGRVLEWFGTCTDIEGQKRYEKELESTVQARDNFFSIASHELKTPITSLRLGLQLLHRGLKKKETDLVSAKMVRDQLTSSIKGIDRIARLIEDLLDISRIRSRKLLIDTERVDFRALVQEVVLHLQVQAQEAQTSIQLFFPSEEIKGDFDQLRIEQVISNLISNAIKYGQGQPVEVHISADSETVSLWIVDHGMGIPKEDQNRIFGWFERAVTLKDFAGLGLGLYITQQIVKAHGGEISVKSDVNQGSTFTILLPRYIKAVEADLKNETTAA